MRRKYNGDNKFWESKSRKSVKSRKTIPAGEKEGNHLPLKYLQRMRWQKEWMICCYRIKGTFIQYKTRKLSEQVDTISLSKEQMFTVDKLVSSYLESGCCYGRMTYLRGIRDCALLLREMELMKWWEDEYIR